MTRFLKNAAKRVLRRYDRRVVHLPRDRASGLDLGHDLRLIITKTRPVCLDVGANVGELIDLFRSALDYPVIHAFEPSSVVFPHLRARGFGTDVSLHQHAMGQSLATAELTNYVGTWMNSLLPLDPDEANRFRRAQSTTTESIEIKTVDWFLAQHGIQTVDLLKVDTQGTELDVLLGAVEAFRTGAIRAVLVELMFERLYIGQSAPYHVIDFLADHGLLLVDYYDKVRDRHRLARCNALFVKEDGPV